jgi:Flp pilus assembly protein TadD
MKKPYLFIIIVFYVGVLCLGIAAQSLAAPPLDDPRGKGLEGAVFELCDAAIDFAKKGHYDRAIALFSKALEINPRYAEAYNNRGIVYAKGKGQNDKAISDFIKAIEINPELADFYDNRGITYERLGDKEKACSDWKWACQLGSCKAYEAAKRKGDC